MVGLGGGVGFGGQGGCEQRIEVFVKIQKKKIRGEEFRLGGGSGFWGVKVDVNKELKFLRKLGGSGGGWVWGGGGQGGFE